MLAFIGHLVGQDKIKSDQIRDLTTSLIWFAVGVACALVALGCSYLANYSIGELSHSRNRTWTHPFIVDGPKSARWHYTAMLFSGLAVLIGLASIALFIVGMVDVRNSIVHVFR
jgi:hypothetical protein